MRAADSHQIESWTRLLLTWRNRNRDWAAHVVAHWLVDLATDASAHHLKAFVTGLQPRLAGEVGATRNDQVVVVDGWDRAVADDDVRLPSYERFLRWRV